MADLYYGEFDTPIGTLLVVTDDNKVVRIDYGTFADHEEKITKWLKQHYTHEEIVASPEKISHVQKQLDEYFSKERTTFELKFAFHGTPFQRKVWEALLQELPYGKAKSYKEIAIAIGNPKAVRAVGGAVNKNPFSILVPCHRVIGANGKLVGYNGGLDKKEYLLKHEEILP
ncbi:methylated-DNA--[protein]-cysteine S-methyltransferase [Ornithinibacillus californiensis]|uniref:methylated-DNA--[protein]-cysteine S-methyltransferase n=1 Tax=Ornithinibacillus californiensis TaxID=161536 RepID=UPI00064DB059|nr:methylated-DNA--[protein]-cysteine S-methyltransferase [Ornithinibacillus californiensis]